MKRVAVLCVCLLAAVVTAHERTASHGVGLEHHGIVKNKPVAGQSQNLQQVPACHRVAPTVSSLVEVQEEMHRFQGWLSADSDAQDVVKKVLEQYRRWCNVNAFDQGHSWRPLQKNFLFVRKLEPNIYIFMYNFKSRISQLQIVFDGTNVERPNYVMLSTFCRFKPHPNTQMLVCKDQSVLPKDIIDRINLIRAKRCSSLPPVGTFTARLYRAPTQQENKLEVLFRIQGTQFVVELYREDVYLLHDIYELPDLRATPMREETKRKERLASYPCRIPPLKKSLVNHEELMQNLIERRRMCHFAVPDITSYRLDNVEYVDLRTRVLVMRINGEMLQITTKVKERSLSGDIIEDTETFSEQSVVLQSIRYQSVAADGKVKWIPTDECILHPEDKAWVSMCSREYHPIPCYTFRNDCRFDTDSQTWLDENRCLVVPAETLAELANNYPGQTMPAVKYASQFKSGSPVAIRKQLDSIWEVLKYGFVLDGYSPIHAEIRTSAKMLGYFYKRFSFELFLKSTFSHLPDLMVQFSERAKVEESLSHDPKYAFFELSRSTGSAPLSTARRDPITIPRRHATPKPDNVDGEEVFRFINNLNVLRRRKCLLAPLKHLVVVKKNHDGYVFATHDDVFIVKGNGAVTDFLKSRKSMTICDVQSDNFARDEAQWILTTLLQSQAGPLISLQFNPTNEKAPYSIFYRTQDGLERLNFLLKDSQSDIEIIARHNFSAPIMEKLRFPYPSKNPPKQPSFFRLWGEHLDEVRLPQPRSDEYFHRVPANYYLLDLIQQEAKTASKPIDPLEVVCKVYKDKFVLGEGKWSTVFHILNTLASQRWATFHRLPNHYFRVILSNSKTVELDIEDDIAETNSYIYRVSVKGNANVHKVNGQWPSSGSTMKDFAKERLEYPFTAPTRINTELATQDSEKRLENLKKMSPCLAKPR
eukprot:GILK01005527.1.p1 GENE.GILK01005527.1~~GILK01005527.1.p1  ORF type:complete len:930 (+),score=108.97 GILK01005527.1:37-2826(+)